MCYEAVLYWGTTNEQLSKTQSHKLLETNDLKGPKGQNVLSVTTPIERWKERHAKLFKCQKK